MTPKGEQPHWSYQDLGFFASAVLPCLAVSLLVLRPVHFPSDGVKAIAFQFLFDSLLLVALYLLIAKRYSKPFWKSLGWTFEFHGAFVCIVIAPVLAIALAALGGVLHTPANSVVQDLMTDRLSLVVVMLFAAILSPIFEELVFRGFLLPLFARSLGTWPAIILSAALFGMVHAPEYQSWQAVMIVGLAGVAFGIARVATGSTTASTILHVGYNSTLFVFYLMQQYVTKLDIRP